MRRLRSRLLAGGTTLVALGLAACDRGETLVFEPIGYQTGATPASPQEGDTVVAALRDPDPFGRARRLANLLPTLGASGVPEVTAILSDPRIFTDGMETELLLHFWSMHDPKAAATWAVESSPPAFRMGAVIATVEPWATQDPRAAEEAVERWTQRPDAAEVVQLALVRGLFARSPSEAAAYIQQMGPGFPRLRSVAVYLRESIRTYGIEPTLKWAESVSDDDPDYKLGVYRQVASVLPSFDRDAALRWCDAQCEGPYGSNVRSLIARRWAEKDGAAAIAWLAARPQSHDRDLALRATYAVWANRHPEEAVAWGRERTRGEMEPWLQPILPPYARQLAEESPREAADLALRIADDEQVEYTLRDVLKKWAFSDAEGARAWFDQAPISDALRAKLQGPAPAGAPTAETVD